MKLVKKKKKKKKKKTMGERKVLPNRHRKWWRHARLDWPSDWVTAEAFFFSFFLRGRSINDDSLDEWNV